MKNLRLSMNAWIAMCDHHLDGLLQLTAYEPITLTTSAVSMWYSYISIDIDRLFDYCLTSLFTTYYILGLHAIGFSFTA